MSIFFRKYEKRKRKLNSLLCLGLDPITEQLPQGYEAKNLSEAMLDFLTDIIEASYEFTVAYKPNCAFFESLGAGGMLLFERLLQVLRKKAPEALVIADAKRADIEHSAAAYAHAFFEKLGVDAITVNPYLGMDCIEPFLSYSEKAVMVLCHTSNPGANQFQSVGNPKLYLQIAQCVSERNQQTQNLWLVVGATKQPQSLVEIRTAAPEVPFLLPGIGSQGGDLEKCLKATGTNVLFNIGRSILYAVKEREQVIKAARKQCQDFITRMRQLS